MIEDKIDLPLEAPALSVERRARAARRRATRRSPRSCTRGSRTAGDGRGATPRESRGWDRARIQGHADRHRRGGVRSGDPGAGVGRRDDTVGIRLRERSVGALECHDGVGQRSRARDPDLRVVDLVGHVGRAFVREHRYVPAGGATGGPAHRRGLALVLRRRLPRVRDRGRAHRACRRRRPGARGLRLGGRCGLAHAHPAGERLHDGRFRRQDRPRAVPSQVRGHLLLPRRRRQPERVPVDAAAGRPPRLEREGRHIPHGGHRLRRGLRSPSQPPERAGPLHAGRQPGARGLQPRPVDHQARHHRLRRGRRRRGLARGRRARGRLQGAHPAHRQDQGIPAGSHEGRDPRDGHRQRGDEARVPYRRRTGVGAQRADRCS